MAVKVTLRKKAISKGRHSFYLDFYPAIKSPKTGKLTRREFLGLYIFDRPKGPLEKQHNKEVKIMAESIKNERFLEIQRGTYGSSHDLNKDVDFLGFFHDLAKKKYTSKGNYDNWLSVYNYLLEFFSNGLVMGDLSETVMEEFREYLLSLDLAQNTKNSYFSKFKASIREAHRRGMIPENYSERVKGIKAEDTKREFLTLEEIQLLHKTDCELPILKNAFLFSALTGLRFSDIQALTWGDLQGNDKDGYFIRFRQRKTKGEETLPIPNPARELMGEAHNPSTKVFKGLKYSAWNNQKLREWVIRAGINKHITFHCARHSFATLQLTMGTDIYVVSDLLGHKELKTTKIYAKIVNERKTEAMNKLNDLKL